MPLPHVKFSCKHDPKVEEIIREGCRILAGQENPQYAQVAQLLTEKHHVPVSRFRLCNCFLGKTKNRQDAHKHQQLLSAEQKKVLVDWIQYLSSTGHLLSKWTIQKKAEDICGKKPSQNWIPLFLGQNPDIKLGKPSGLDPK